jgi:hypothetical protein
MMKATIVLLLVSIGILIVIPTADAFAAAAVAAVDRTAPVATTAARWTTTELHAAAVDRKSFLAVGGMAAMMIAASPLPGCAVEDLAMPSPEEQRKLDEVRSPFLLVLFRTFFWSAYFLRCQLRSTPKNTTTPFHSTLSQTTYGLYCLLSVCCAAHVFLLYIQGEDYLT